MNELLEPLSIKGSLRLFRIGYGFEKYGKIAHASGHGANVVHGRGKRQHAFGADTAVRWLEAGYPAIGGRPRNRTARLLAQGSQAQAASHGPSGTAAGSARRPFKVPRIPRCSSIQASIFPPDLLAHTTP